VQAALVLDDEDTTTRAAVAALARAAGASVVHELDGLVVVEAPRDLLPRLDRIPGVREVTDRTTSGGRRASRSEPFRGGLGAWNRRGAPRRRAAVAREPPQPCPPLPPDDALAPPAIPPSAVRDALRAAAALRSGAALLQAAGEGGEREWGAPYGAT